MKLIIEMPEDIYKFVCQLSCEDSYHYDDVVLTSVKNGTPIPDNATNGDVIKALFHNVNYEEGYVYVKSNTHKNVIMTVREDWWNAPYQKGGKE